jgi:hypothetical protein
VPMPKQEIDCNIVYGWIGLEDKKKKKKKKKK